MSGQDLTQRTTFRLSRVEIYTFDSIGRCAGCVAYTDVRLAELEFHCQGKHWCRVGFALLCGSCSAELLHNSDRYTYTDLKYVLRGVRNTPVPWVAGRGLG